MMNRLITLTGIILIAVGLGACARSQVTERSASEPFLAFENGIQQVFEAKCTPCHGEEAPAQGLRLDSWDAVFEGGEEGEAVIPFDAENSLLVELLTELEGGPHPAELGADTVTTEELNAIRSWIEEGARNDDGQAPFSESRNLLYACNQGDASISVIDMDAKVVIRTVDLRELGFSATSRPHHVAVEPGGEHWYVSLIGADAVLKFNRQNDLVGRTEFERPGMLVADPERDILLVGRSMKAVNPPQRIGSIDRSTMSIEELDVFIARPHALALSKDDRFIYTASLAANQVVTMNRETEQVDLYNVPGPIHTLVQFAVSPDGGTLAVGGQLTGKLLFFDLSQPDAPVLVDSLDVAAAPWHPVYSPDGRHIYFGNKGADKVTIVNARTRALEAEISGRGIAQPHGSTISADGRYLFISNNNLDGSYTPRYDLDDNSNVGTVVVIDTALRRIVKVIEVGLNTTGLGAATGS